MIQYMQASTKRAGVFSRVIITNWMFTQSYYLLLVQLHTHLISWPFHCQRLYLEMWNILSVCLTSADRQSTTSYQHSPKEWYIVSWGIYLNGNLGNKLFLIESTGLVICSVLLFFCRGAWCLLGFHRHKLKKISSWSCCIRAHIVGKWEAELTSYVPLVELQEDLIQHPQQPVAIFLLKSVSGETSLKLLQKCTKSYFLSHGSQTSWSRYCMKFRSLAGYSRHLVWHTSQALWVEVICPFWSRGKLNMQHGSQTGWNGVQYALDLAWGRGMTLWCTFLEETIQVI